MDKFLLNTFLRNIRIFRLLYSQTSKRQYSCDHISTEDAFSVPDILFRVFHVWLPIRLGRRFTSSQINVFPYNLNKDGELMNPYRCSKEQSRKSRGFLIGLRPLFGEGITKIQNMTESRLLTTEHLENWSSGCLGKALHTLEKFTDNIEFHEKCLSKIAENDRKYSEIETKVLLANHLFKPLVSCNTEEISCVISNNSEFRIAKCPCVEYCETKIMYGDCSYGSQHLWFGRGDMMLLPIGGGSVNVNIENSYIFDHAVNDTIDQATRTSEVCRQESQRRGERSYRHKLRSEKNVNQIVSQAITFSLYQRKDQIETSRSLCTTLIPTIFCSKHYFDVYLYDSENDILLRNLGPPIPIFKRKVSREEEVKFEAKFDYNSIILLWMLINHSLLQPNFTTRQVDTLKGSCGVKMKLEKENLMETVQNSLRSHSNFFPPQMIDEAYLENVS